MFRPGVPRGLHGRLGMAGMAGRPGMTRRVESGIFCSDLGFNGIKSELAILHSVHNR